MKLVKKLLSVVLLCLFITACDVSLNNPASPEQDGMVLVHIGFLDISSRSIMPNLPSKESITFLYLYGTSSIDTHAQEVLLSGFKGNLDEASVLLKPGKWNFTLEAYLDSNDDPVLKGVRKNIDISVGYSAAVQFTLLPIYIPDNEGTAWITIELPDDIDVNMVETVIDGVILEPPLEIEESIIRFYDIMPAGDYLVHFFLKDSEDKVVAVISEMLVIQNDLESGKIITLTEDDFNLPPGIPANFRATFYDEENVTFNWENNSHNETGFVFNNGTTDFEIDAGLTSYIVEDADPIGKTFTLYAINDFGVSPTAEYRAFIPETPTEVTAHALSISSIVISWQAVDGASNYIIQRATASNGTYSRVGTSTGTSYSNTGLSPGTTYYYRVITSNAFGDSPVSAVVSTQTTALPVPSGVTASVQSSNSIRLSWNSISGAQSYRIYRSSDAAGIYSLIDTSTTNSYTNTGLSSSTTYYYKVSQVNSSNSESGQSSYASAKTSAASILSSPSNINAIPVNGGIRITWNPVTNAQGYTIYRATAATGAYTAVVTNAAGTTSVNTVSGNTTYYYKVATVNGDGVTGNQSGYVSSPGPGVLTTLPNYSATSSWLSGSISSTGTLYYRFQAPADNYTWIRWSDSYNIAASTSILVAKASTIPRMPIITLPPGTISITTPSQPTKPTGDIVVSAWFEDTGQAIFTNVDDGANNSSTRFFSSTARYIIVMVKPYSTSSGGTFLLKYQH